MSVLPSSGFSPFRSSVVTARPTFNQPMVAQASDSTAALPQAEIRAVDPNGWTCLEANSPWALNAAKNGGSVAQAVGLGVNSVTSKYTNGVDVTGAVSNTLSAVDVAADTVNSPNPGFTAFTEGAGALESAECAPIGWNEGSALGAEAGCEVGLLADGIGCIPLAAAGYLGGGVLGTLGLGYGCGKVASYAAEQAYDGVTGAPSCPSGWVPVKNSDMFPPVDGQSQSQSQYPFTPMLTPVPPMAQIADSQTAFSGVPLATPTPTPAPVPGPTPTAYDPSTAFQGSYDGSYQSSVDLQSTGSFDGGFGDSSPACFDTGSSMSEDMGSSMSCDFSSDMSE